MVHVTKRLCLQPSSQDACLAGCVTWLPGRLCSARPPSIHAADAFIRSSTSLHSLAPALGQNVPARGSPCCCQGVPRYEGLSGHREPRQSQHSIRLSAPRAPQVVCAQSSTAGPGPAASSPLSRSFSGRPGAADLVQGASPGQRLPERSGTSAKAGTMVAAPVAVGIGVLSDEDLRAAQEVYSDVAAALGAVDDFVAEGQLAAALHLIQALAETNQTAVLSRLSHAPFLRAAKQRAQRGARRIAVDQTLQFLRLVPPAAADPKSCTAAVAVCATACKPEAAQEVARLFRASGGIPDEPFYAALIVACASRGSIEEAARLYEELAAIPGAHGRGHRAHSAMIAACSQAMQLLSPQDRRGRLVLLQRALRVADDIRGVGAEPSIEVLHALAVASGHAGQVQQALQICRELQGKGAMDVRMFTILVHAAATAGKRELALSTYRRALRTGLPSSVYLFTAAIGACSTPGQPSDIDTALKIYNDMLRAGVQPDARLFAVLIRVAGRAGRLDVAMEMHDAMQEAGIAATRATQSALVGACVASGALDRALAMLTDGQKLWQRMPLRPGFNALLAGLARCGRLDDIISTLAAMRSARLPPDSFSYAAVLSVCQRLKAHRLAFAVYRLMRQQGVAVDEAVCFVALRVCFNALRAHWSPGGYPPLPHSAQAASWVSNRSAEALLATLDNHSSALGALYDMVHDTDADQAHWTNQALAVYRDALAAGCRPRLHVLERVLACLRLPVSAAPPAGQPAAALARPVLPAVKGSWWATNAESGVHSDDLPSPFDMRAVAIVQGAVAQGMLPPAGASIVDLRSMPPNLAQAYLLTSLIQIRRSLTVHRRTEAPAVTVLVPPFNWADIWLPSYLADVDLDAAEDDPNPSWLSADYWDDDSTHLAEDRQQHVGADEDAWLGDQSLVAHPGQGTLEEGPRGPQAPAPAPAAGAPVPGPQLPGHCPLDQRIGLGVAGMLRRIGLHARVDTAAGRIHVRGAELGRWLRQESWSGKPSGEDSPAAPLHDFGIWKESQLPIAEQQRRIRLGLQK